MFGDKELIFTAETTPDLSMDLVSSISKIIPLIGKVLTGEKIFDYLPESVNNFFSLSFL